MIWLVILITGLVTYAFRLSFIVALERMQMPALLQRALGYVPAAVLSAIVVPELVLHGDNLDPSPTNPRLVAGIVAALVAWRTRNVLLTIVVGMVVLLLMQMLLAGLG